MELHNILYLLYICININEILSEVSHKHIISLHVRITIFYGYIKNHAFCSENETVWSFIGVYKVMYLWVRDCCECFVDKYTHALAAQ